MADEQLKYRIDEVLRISQNLITAVGEIRDVQAKQSEKLENIESEVSTIKHNVKYLKKEFVVARGQITDIATKVLEMLNRLFDIENQMKTFSDRFANLENEYKQIYSETLKIFGDIDDSPETKAKVKELDKRVEKLEEEVFA